MVRFTQIKWLKRDQPLLSAVRACSGTWSTEHQAIQDLRRRLLDLQNWRCVYCQIIIDGDVAGLREIEHVLPKSSSYRCSIAKGMSNNDAFRRSTLGYANYTYEPLNLAVCCKLCNTKKGSYDPLRDRSQPRPLLVYPGVNDFLWVHPHHHRYFNHIIIDQNFIYMAKSDYGARVISACGLDKAEILEKKFGTRARAHARSTAAVQLTIRRMVDGVRAGEFGQVHAVREIAKKFKIDEADAQRLFDLVNDDQSIEAIERGINACLALEATLKSERQRRPRS